MGFLDKAKEQASALASKAQDAASQGQAKLDAAQAKKHADGLLRDLGAWHYAQRTGRDNGTGAAEIERLHGELQAHEAEHGPLGGERPEQPSAAPATATPDVPVSSPLSTPVPPAPPTSTDTPTPPPPPPPPATPTPPASAAEDLSPG